MENGARLRGIPRPHGLFASRLLAKFCLISGVSFAALALPIVTGPDDPTVRGLNYFLACNQPPRDSLDGAYSCSSARRKRDDSRALPRDLHIDAIHALQGPAVEDVNAGC